MRNFQELLIWQKSHSLTLMIYKICLSFPKEEVYGLISQMRRSSSSIPTNIAEGCGRNSNPEMRRFLIISSGSSSELEYQLLLARDLNYISQDIYKELSDLAIEIRKMLHSFIKSLEVKSDKKEAS
ncbi:MAG: ribosomal protein [Sphingobacteriales bacterium]|nr:ribosomal protein [Sphingobacteriales bacterium]